MRMLFISLQHCNSEMYPAFSLVELLDYWALIGRELQSLEIFQYVPMPALLCHKEQAQETKAPDMVGFRTKYPHWHLWVFLAFQWFFMAQAIRMHRKDLL